MLFDGVLIDGVPPCYVITFDELNLHLQDDPGEKGSSSIKVTNIQKEYLTLPKRQLA